MAGLARGRHRARQLGLHVELGASIHGAARHAGRFQLRDTATPAVPDRRPVPVSRSPTCRRRRLLLNSNLARGGFAAILVIASLGMLEAGSDESASPVRLVR